MAKPATEIVDVIIERVVNQLPALVAQAVKEHVESTNGVKAHPPKQFDPARRGVPATPQGTVQIVVKRRKTRRRKESKGEV